MFLALYQVHSVHFSFSTFFSVSCLTPGPTLFVSNFPRFSVFFAIFHVLPWEFLIFLACHFSRTIPVTKMWVSHIPCRSVLSPNSRSYCGHFSFLMFFSVSCHIPCPTMCFPHFTRFSVFIAVFHILLFEIHLFLVCQFSRPIPGFTVFMSHFTGFSVFSP